MQELAHSTLEFQVANRCWPRITEAPLNTHLARDELQERGGLAPMLWRAKITLGLEVETHPTQKAIQFTRCS
jgi:hypothetical protein